MLGKLQSSLRSPRLAEMTMYITVLSSTEYQPAAQSWLPNIGRGDGRFLFGMQEINSLCSCPPWFLGIKGLALELEDSERHPCDVSVQCEGFGIQNLCLLFLICLIIAFLSSTPLPYGSLVTQEMFESWVQDVSTLHTLCLWDCRQRYVEKTHHTNLETEVIGSTFIGTGFQRVSASFLQMLGSMGSNWWLGAPNHCTSIIAKPHRQHRGSTFVGQRVPTILRSFWVAHPPFFGPEWVFRSRTSSWAMLDH